MAPPFSQVHQSNTLRSSLTPLFLSHLTSNPSASLVGFCFEMDLKYAQFSSPRCYPTISHVDDCSRPLPALPASSLAPTPPLQPLPPMQIEESYWIKVRPRPSSAQHPPVALTKVLILALRDLPDLARVPLSLISHNLPAGPWYAGTMASCSCCHRQSMVHLQHLRVPCPEPSSPRFLNASLPHLLRPLRKHHLILTTLSK